MAAGRPITRSLGQTFPTKPNGGTAGTSVTVTGTHFPHGDPIEVAWGSNNLDQPTSGGWTAATVATVGTWTVTLNRPATPGTYWFWSRCKNRPRVGQASGPVTIT